MKEEEGTNAFGGGALSEATRPHVTAGSAQAEGKVLQNRLYLQRMEWFNEIG